MAGSVDAPFCSPEELIPLMKAGDVAALDRMTRCYGERLLSMGRKHCSTEDQAHDAVQDALLAAGTHLTDFRGEGSIEGWLVRMVTNACRRMRRGLKNDPTVRTELTDEHGEEDDTPESLAARAELGVALGDVLLELKPRDRVILILSDGAGWSAPEIADKLEVSANAVRVRLSRIRRQLRDSLSHVWRDWAPDQ